MSPNFTECGIKFTADSGTLYANYSYHGPVYGAIDPTHRPALITLSGCQHLCGYGPQNYEWSAAANTITTWVLPVIGGLLLQAPFESNRFWRTIFAISRWIGSPICALTSILWNIKVTAKCALMVDMSTRYDEVPGEGSEFSQMRDSFYILAVMNQFAIKPRMPGLEAEKLLRIALFSDSLKLSVDQPDSLGLVKQREMLAYDLRRGRRRGIVPVFVSFLWFLFSLGLSLQSAFGQLGQNATAHNLALGLLLAWLPVFIMGSIVDRNPMASDDIRQRLNNLLDMVRHALLNPQLRNTYMRDTHRTEDDFLWTGILDDDDYFQDDFFVDFAGQGRSRWHYGVAHPILASIEDVYVANYGRDWMRDAELARTKLVLGPERLTGLRWFDFRELWQIASAFAIVLGTVGGAFCISYFTPTVGLGCRSGGYMIFVVIAMFSFFVEMAVWWQVSLTTSTAATLLHRTSIPGRLETFQENVSRRLSRQDSNSWSNPSKDVILKFWTWFWNLPFRQKVEYFVLRPCDVANTCWLIYIVLAQTFGWYRTCYCMSSVWGGKGGYLDFEDLTYYKAHGVILYWATGTTLSITVLAVSVIFIVVEWCEQSHLSTENYANARRGLLRTRKWKRYTSWCRDVPDWLIQGVKHARWRVLGRRGRYGRRSLVWEHKVRERRGAGAPLLVEGRAVGEEEEDVDLDGNGMGRKGSESISMKGLSAPAQSYSRGTSLGVSPGRRNEGLGVSPRASNEALSIQGSAISAGEAL